MKGVKVKKTAKKASPSCNDAFDYVKLFFESLGYSVLERPAKEDNDCDMYVVGEKRTAKVEIKVMRKMDNGTWQAPAVTENQRHCDICAVLLPNGYVFVEKMGDYLAVASPDGYRQFTWLKL